MTAAPLSRGPAIARVSNVRVSETRAWTTHSHIQSDLATPKARRLPPP